MSQLFSPLTLRELTLRNRIGVSPMCQYSAVDGLASDWHLVHLGSFATGGAGLVISEAIAVAPEGRISAHDLGLWDDAQIPMLRRITDFLHAQGTIAGIQLAHAGRKASCRRPWDGVGAVRPAEGGWTVKGPGTAPFSPAFPTPVALTTTEIAAVVGAFGTAAERAVRAGFKVAEIHAAHGYLLHEFLSPLSNDRTDAYGGSYAHRTRLLHEVVRAVRAVWPAEWPLFVRLSTTDWIDGGWTLEDSVRLSVELKSAGVDLIDCSSAGLDPRQQLHPGPGYQVPFARRIREAAGIPTAAVGLITAALQAEQIVVQGDADLVLLGREMLRNPHWPLMAAHALGAVADWPRPYERAKPH